MKLGMGLGNEKGFSGPVCAAFSTGPLKSYVFKASCKISFMLQILTLGWDRALLRANLIGSGPSRMVSFLNSSKSIDLES